MRRAALTIVAAAAAAAAAPIAAAEESGAASLAEKLRTEPDASQDKRDRWLQRLTALGAEARPVIFDVWAELPPREGALLLMDVVYADPSGTFGVLTEAARSSVVEHRRAAALLLMEHYQARPEEVTDVLLELAEDPVQAVAVDALVAIGRTGAARAWDPLLDLLSLELRGAFGEPRPQLRSQIQLALAASFNARPEPRRLERLFRVAALVASEEYADPADVLEPLAHVEHELALPVVRRILRESYGFAPMYEFADAEPLVDERDEVGVDVVADPIWDVVFDPDGHAYDLRPWSAGVRRVAVRGLGRQVHRGSVALLARALNDPDRRVRQQAIAVARRYVTPDDRLGRLTLCRAMVHRLTDSDRVIRKQAHEWLVRVTGADLPQSDAKWRWWVEREELDARVQADLTRRVREYGFESIEAMREAYGLESTGDLIDFYGFEDRLDLIESIEEEANR